MNFNLTLFQEGSGRSHNYVIENISRMQRKMRKVVLFKWRFETKMGVRENEGGGRFLSTREELRRYKEKNNKFLILWKVVWNSDGDVADHFPPPFWGVEIVRFFIVLLAHRRLLVQNSFKGAGIFKVYFECWVRWWTAKGIKSTNWWGLSLRGLEMIH